MSGYFDCCRSEQVTLYSRHPWSPMPSAIHVLVSELMRSEGKGIKAPKGQVVDVTYLLATYHVQELRMS